ncbi:unnamed protein product [Arabidopsis thaliana]|uniref:(thale cress) hypothetical protein n=1 Tax=Arabidopsis thaliana TaxID=3702 RepID=A0A7G2F7B8_ARATH|nr:unnamed protein product [Arabidopsis thaliana]
MADPVLQSPKNSHFFQPLLPGFDSYLNIPVKFFSKRIQGRNEGRTVELRTDASEKTWQVKIQGRRLTVGWKEFASAHDFRVGDIIVFRHEGSLVFHVTALGPSCCEIQYVPSCNNQENISNLSMKQSIKTELESSLDEDKVNMGKFPRKKHVKKRIPEAEATSFSSDKSCFVAHVTDSNVREDTLFLPRKFDRSDGLIKGSNKIVLMNEEARTLILKFRNSSRTFYMRGGWTSFCHEHGLKPGDSVTFKLERNNTKTPLLRFSTAELKSVSTKDFNKIKRKESGDSSQIVPSSSSSVSEYRFLTLTVTPAALKDGRLRVPIKFIKGNRMENLGMKKITLLDKHGVEWPVNLVMYKGNTQTRFSSGLKEFFKANGIEACKSFVLELVWEEDKTTLPMLKFCSKAKN